MPNIVFEVVAGGALASLVVPMLAGGIAAGDREQVRRTASALLGWTLLLLVPLAALLAACAAADRHRAARRGRRRPGQGRPGRPLPASSSPRRWCSTGSPSCSPACCRRTAASPARRWRRCCPPSSWPPPTCCSPASAATGTSTGLAPSAELVLGVGTTLGVVALTVALLPPLRGLRLGLRPALRFPVGAAPRVRRLALAGVLTLAGQQLVGDRGDPAGQRRRPRRHPGRLLRRDDGVPAALGGAGGADRHLGVPGAERARRPGRRDGLRVGARPGRRPDRGDRRGRRRRAGRGLRPDGPGLPGLGRRRRRRPRRCSRTIAAFAPGLVGYGLVALLSRALYARGLWRSPTVCVAGGWLVAVAADVVLVGGPARRRPGAGPGRRAQHRRHRRRARAAGRRRPGGRRRGAGRGGADRRRPRCWPVCWPAAPGC